MKMNDEQSQHALDAILQIGGFETQRDVLQEIASCVDVMESAAKTKADIQTIREVRSLVRDIMDGN